MEEIIKGENPNLNNKNSIVNTPAGYGKGINDYYNHYITVADAKSGAILAANFILLGALININICCCYSITYLLSSLTSIISIILCVFVLYPRLTKPEKGLIFWENIKNYSSVNEYLNDVRQLDISKVEEEYAKQNWHVSKILSSKNKNIRHAIIFFVISLILLVITYLT